MAKKTILPKLSLQQMVAAAAVTISVVFLVAFGGQILEIYRLRGALATAETRVTASSAEKAALEATKTFVMSDPYVIGEARTDLNMVQKGDQRVVIVPRPAANATPTPLPSASGTQSGSSNFRRWWDLLFGS
jgi:hypothetical protein